MEPEEIWRKISIIVSSLSLTNREAHKAYNWKNIEKQKKKTEQRVRNLTHLAHFRGLKFRDGGLTIGDMRVTLKYTSLISIKPFQNAYRIACPRDV